MQVQEIAPGLWRWTGMHPEWKREVGCVYLEAPDSVVLVDPLVPPEDAERFWSALDRDVERAGRPVHVLLTVFWHARSAYAVADRYGAEIWAHEQVLSVQQREVEPTRTFASGDELPGGVEPRDASRFDEAILWIPPHRALVFGDVVLGADEQGGLRLCPESWLGKGGTHAALRETLRPLLELPVERLLVSHGEPVLEGAREELARVLGDDGSI